MPIDPVIGVYTGREDNIFWRRIPGSENGKVEAAGARALCEKDAEPLGRNIIHSVTSRAATLNSLAMAGNMAGARGGGGSDSRRSSAAARTNGKSGECLSPMIARSQPRRCWRRSTRV